MTEFDDLISRALHEHADHVELTPASFESVRRRARLRRSRHIALAVSPVLVAVAYASTADRRPGLDLSPAAGPMNTETAIGPDPAVPTTMCDESLLVTEPTVTTVVLPTDSTVVLSSVDPAIPLAGTTTTTIIEVGAPPMSTSMAVDHTVTEDSTTTIAPDTAAPGPTTTIITVIDTRCDTDIERVAAEMGCSIDDTQLALEPGTEFAAECDEGLTAWCTVTGGVGMPTAIDCTAVTIPRSVPDVTSATTVVPPTSTGG